MWRHKKRVCKALEKEATENKPNFEKKREETMSKYTEKTPRTKDMQNTRNIENDELDQLITMVVTMKELQYQNK